MHRHRMWILIRRRKFCPSSTWVTVVTLAIWLNSIDLAFLVSSTWRPISRVTSTSFRVESFSNNCRQPIPVNRIYANISTTLINSSVRCPFFCFVNFFVFFFRFRFFTHSVVRFLFLRHNDSLTHTQSLTFEMGSRFSAWLTHCQWNRRKLDLRDFFVLSSFFLVCVCVCVRNFEFLLRNEEMGSVVLDCLES